MPKKIKDDSIIKDTKDTVLEHKTVVPYNTEIEKKKNDLRKKEEELRKTGNVEDIIITTLDGVEKKPNELTKHEKEMEFVRCASDPIYFIENYLTIFDQTQGDGGKIVRFRLFEIQKNLVKEYQNNQFNVVNKYRQAGISTTTCAYIAWYIMFKEHRNIAIVADKLETARDELMRDVVAFIESCPAYLKPEPIYKDTQKHKHYDNDCQLRAFASNSLRGYTPTLLFWDEVAWAEKGEKFWTAARPTLQTGGNAIFVSTPNSMDAVFYKTFQGAIIKKNNFNAVELWWYNDPRYNKGLQWVKNKNKQNEIRIDDQSFTFEKRKQLVSDGWEATSPWFEFQLIDYNGDMRRVAQELLCSFLGSGDNFIAEEYLKKIEEKDIRTPIRQEYIDNEMWIWEDPLPNEEYVISFDASAGHSEDYSTINVLKIKEFIEEKTFIIDGKEKKKKVKIHKLEQVAEYYNKVKPQTLAEIGYIYGKKYNDAYAVVDVSGGYGGHTVEKLIELGYINIHYTEITHKPTRDRLSGYIKIGSKVLPDGKMVNVDLVPGFFISSNRGIILTELQRAINLSDVIIRSLRTLNELKTFINVPGSRVADHKRSFHDDSIMGLACGIYVVNYQMTNFKNTQEKTKKILDAFLKLNGDEVVEKNKPFKNMDSNKNTSTPDYRISKTNPYGANSWLFNDLYKK